MMMIACVRAEMIVKKNVDNVYLYPACRHTNSGAILPPRARKGDSMTMHRNNTQQYH